MRTSIEVKDKFLKHAEIIMVKQIDLALSERSEDKTLSAKAQDKIMDALLQMAVRADDVRKIEATNSRDTLQLLSQGKISITEAQDLMQIMSTKFEMEELSELTEQLRKANEEGR